MKCGSMIGLIAFCLQVPVHARAVVADGAGRDEEDLLNLLVAELHLRENQIGGVPQGQRLVGGSDFLEFFRAEKCVVVDEALLVLIAGLILSVYVPSALLPI